MHPSESGRRALVYLAVTEEYFCFGGALRGVGSIFFVVEGRHGLVHLATELHGGGDSSLRSQAE